MNTDILLDRKFFNINTRIIKNNLIKKENIKKQDKKEEYKKEEDKKDKKNKIIYMDRNDFKKEIKEDVKDKKIQNMQFNSYLIKYRTKKNIDRIGFENNNKEQIFYKPYERNDIKIENKNLNNLDFIDKNKNTEYYKKINLKKFNPNINYKDFI